MLIENVH